ncbi:unnamed protein product [Schistosoma rodhaini]|uniref:MARVEL domain-containing protein n=1 Tax=Schistosoma rodhaini TaxID=6188 RepID=A0AA85G965_9TREM|nr:unnamed protein product [Schistosoma rodhaini]
MPLNAEYARELRAVFKILEFSIGVGLVVSIVVADRYRITVAGAFITFFALIGVLTSLFFFVVHLSSLIYKIPGPVTLIEFISIKLCAILALIAMIITAATGGGFAAPIASAILFAVSFVFYGIDTFILFSYYRLNGGYVNDPKIKQRPNIPPKVNQTSEAITPPEYPNVGFEKE